MGAICCARIESSRVGRSLTVLKKRSVREVVDGAVTGGMQGELFAEGDWIRRRFGNSKGINRA